MIHNSIPSPREGDHLFRGGDVDWWHNACLNYLRDHLSTYAEGYKLAADLLVEYVKETRSEQDSLVYPIVFLYRHYIELRLKEIIRDGNLLLEAGGGFPQHHKIDELWRQCREILEEVWPEDSAEHLDAVEECIHEFSEADPTSAAFRYPTDKQDKPSLPGLTDTNLRNLSDIMERIGLLLEGASVGISVLLDHEREMEADLGIAYP